MMCSFSSGWGSILYSQQSGFFFFFLFRSKVSEMSRALWENMGLQGYVCLDNRSQPRAARHKKLLVHEATTAAPSSAAGQGALTFESEALVHKHPSSMGSHQPEGCVWYWGNRGADLCCWWTIDLISCSFFRSWTFTCGPVLPLLMKNL